MKVAGEHVCRVIAHIISSATDSLDHPETHPCVTMESKDDAVPELVLENAESGLQAARIDDAEELADRGLIVHPFKKWVNSLRKNWRPPLPEKFVEGWPDADGNTLSPYHGAQDQQWESLSAYSSQLGTVKTTSMSVPSQRGVRSRGTTASTTNQSGNSDTRTSIDSLKPTQSATLDEAAHSRSIKRRQLLQEIVDTESDYVSGLKSLSNVCSGVYLAAFLLILSRCLASFRPGPNFVATSSEFGKSTIVFCFSFRTSHQSPI
jgi:hypothetical protein